MKFLIINTLFLFIGVFTTAQTRDMHYYIDQAKKNSPLINKAENNNKTLQLDMQMAKSSLTKPVVNVEGYLMFAPIISHDNNRHHFQWVSEGANSYTGYDLAATDGGQYQAYVSVEQPLFKGNVYEAYSRRAEIQSEINKNSIKLTGHELEMLVSRQYINCLLAKHQTQISKSLLNKMEEQLLVIQQLVKNAIYKQTDLLLMQIETENFRVNYEKYKTAYERNISDLNILCGIEDTGSVELSDINLKIKTAAVTRSGFLNKYKLDSMNIVVGQTLFEQKYRPQVSIFANAGMNATYLPAFNRFGFATGLSFKWNIFDGNRKKIQQNRSFVDLQTIEFEKKNFVKQYNTYKEKFIRRITAIDKQIGIVHNQLTEYQKLFKLYQYELSQAQVSVMDFKNLIMDISAKEQERLRLEMEKQMLISSYNYWNY